MEQRERQTSAIMIEVCRRESAKPLRFCERVFASVGDDVMIGVFHG
jgi:hypothetical protein